jgi:hypothetical protein
MSHTYGEAQAELALLERMGAIPEATLWKIALGAKPPPGTWHVYHTGELYNAPPQIGRVTRELMRRRLAVLAQRRPQWGPGFDYLIAARALPHAEPIADAPAVPKSTGRPPSVESRLILDVYDRGQDRAATAQYLGLSRDKVYHVLYENGRAGPRSK